MKKNWLFVVLICLVLIIPGTVAFGAMGPYGGRLWTGNNPFHQPAETTDYYGSGDVDNDGNLTAADVTLAQAIADGCEPPVSRADVDGDEDVDNDDVVLINAAVGGGTLDGWWNSLTTRSQRNDWVDKFLAIDQTSEHCGLNWFMCNSFASQTFMHGAFYRGDLNTTLYDGGQTFFNVPMYYVTLSHGHAINAILVGDDPLDFDDWRFIEPQTDQTALPGQDTGGLVSMRYGDTVGIVVPSFIGKGHILSNDKVVFYVYQSGDTYGWDLVSNSGDLILTRPVMPSITPDNRPDLWNPRIMPTEKKMVLFDSCRDDMTRMTDIHLAELPLSDHPQGIPLTMSEEYSRLLDVFKEPNETIHLLWKNKDEALTFGYYYFEKPGVFHGILDPNGQLTNATRVSTGTRMVRMGRVVVVDGETHIFWLEEYSDDFDAGIWWTRWTGSEWQAEQNIAPGDVSCPSDWNYRDFLRYYFDVDIAANDDVVLAYAERTSGEYANLCSRNYAGGAWGSENIIKNDHIGGVDILTDSDGVIHLAYWQGKFNRNIWTYLHKCVSTDNGSSWLSDEVIDGGYAEDARCPRMARAATGGISMLWEKKLGNNSGDPVVPKWSNCVGGQWYSHRQLPVRSGAIAWYPTAQQLDDGSVMAAWSSRSDDLATIETMGLYPGDFDIDGDVDMNDFSILALAWHSSNGDGNWNPICNIGVPIDNVINEFDLVVFAADWLAGTAE
ncbi:MAG: hypothetical protein K8R02_05595 [Anaerohalosphaeraceae bacterium]|nr:hypothetical protein [Anaerohalosphaeraceae bacterium]